MQKTNCYEDRINATDPNRNIWVSASAGTGKTSLLINRIIRILLSGCKPSKIVAITFTNAAALEIKERILTRLKAYQKMERKLLRQELSFLTGGDASEEMCDRAEGLYFMCRTGKQDIQIQTIHSFCLNILTEFSKEAGLLAGFAIASNNQQERMLKQARMELLSNDAAKESLAYLASKLNFMQITNVLGAITSSRSKMIYLLFKAGSVQQLLEHIKEQCDVSVDDQESLEDLFFTECNFGIFRRFCALLQNYGTNREADLISGYQDILDSGKRDDILQLMKSLFMTKAGERKKSLATKAVKSQIDNFLEIEEFAEFLVDYHKSLNALSTYKDTEAVIIIATLFLETLERIKQSENLIDYDDVILRMLGLLFSSNEREWVIYRLRDQISHLLLDEAQDTSPLQWDIAKELISNLLTEQKDFLKSIFVVGDQKQSIFSFQGADFTGFQSNYEELQKILSQYQQEFLVIKLKNSFRSQPLILNFVDKIFNNVELYSHLTTDDKWLYHGPQREDNQFGECIIHPLTEPSRQDSERVDWDFPEFILPKENEHLNLAKNLVRHVKTMHDEQGMEYGDVMILVRNRNQLYHALKDEFKQCDIPVGTDEEICLNEHVIFMDLVSIGKFCLDPDDDYNLASLLKSPFFRLSEEDVFTLCNDRGDDSVYQRVVDSLPEVAQKLESMRCLFGEFHYLESYLQLLSSEKVLLEYESEFGKSEADILIANIKEEIFNAKREDVLSLTALIKYLGETKKRIKLNTKAPGTISLLTIHAAKGLQAPLVILADLNFKLRKSPRDLLLFNDELCLANIRSLSFALKDEMVNHLKEVNYRENLRLIYVALTRAEDKLHIFGIQNDEGFYSHLTDAASSLAYEELSEGYFFRGEVACYDKLEEVEPDNVVELGSGDEVQAQEVPSDVSEDTYETLLGTYIHETWQQLSFRAQEDEVRALVKDIHSQKWIEADDRQEFAHSLARFIKSSFWLDLQKNYKLKTEVALASRGSIFRIDYLAESVDEIVILELKTDKNTSVVPEQYKTQLQNYQNILAKIHPQKQIKPYVLFLRNLSYFALC